MKNISDIIIIGGDRRMSYAAGKLGEKYNCGSCGTAAELCSECGGNKYDAAVLPIVCGQDDAALLTGVIHENACVFAGKISPELEALCRANGYELYSYLEREEFAVLNAVLTAEGAVAAAINETETALSGADVLVLGHGRIAKITAAYFSALGAEVSVAARKKSDLAWISAEGHRPVDITSDDRLIPALAAADIIINTVPARILTAKRADAVGKDALLIELASVSCTGEHTAFRVLKAGGLPGKVSPMTAGYIIAETINNIIEERSLKNGGA